MTPSPTPGPQRSKLPRRRRVSRAEPAESTRARPARRRRRRWLLALGAGALFWMSRGIWLPPPPQPQMILVLGGDVAREEEAGRLARRYGLPVVVSGGSNPEYAQWLFANEGLRRSQFQLDYRAHDTLTNFTSLVDELKRARVRHLLLVTSSDHMPRALLIGRIVAGSRGIQITPVPVPCGNLCHPEGRRKVWGDGFRALVWVLTGRDVRAWGARPLGALLQQAGLGPTGH